MNISNPTVGFVDHPFDFVCDKVSSLGNRVIKAIKYVKNSIVVDLATKTISLSSDIIKAIASALPKMEVTNDLLKQLQKEIGKIKKVTVASLVSVPFTLFDVGIKFFDFIKEAYHFCRTGNKGQITNVALLALAAFGDLLELPGKVARGVALFMDVPMAIWTTALSTAAAVFSISSIIYSVRSHMESTKVINEMENAKNKAILNYLKNNLPSTDISINKDYLLSEIEKALKNNKLSDLPAVVKTFFEIEGKKSSLIVKDALYAGKMGSLNSIKNRDDAFLSKHFQLEGEKIKSAIASIEKSNSHKKIDSLCDILDKRISTKRLSDKLSALADTVTLVAGIMFLVLEFGVACSPLAPIAYALVIAAGSCVLAKAIIEYFLKKRAEAQLKGI
jgi:hypothetical protein